jgi:hypothetical protein
VASIDSAWSIFDWMDLSQNAAMFGLASLGGYHPTLLQEVGQGQVSWYPNR